MVGMESAEFASARGVIDNVQLMKEYRETADPSTRASPARAIAKSSSRSA